MPFKPSDKAMSIAAAVLVLAASIMVFSSGCFLKSPLGPSTPIAAAPSPTPVPLIPTVAATALPGAYPLVPMTVLGQVPCSGNTNGAKPAVLRSLADWNAWIGAGTCAAAPPGALDLSTFNFSAETVVILQDMNCGSMVNDALHIWEIGDKGTYLVARSDLNNYPPVAQMDCNTYAVAIPATTRGIAWTICLQQPTYHCLTPVTP